ncbi:MAG: class I SAM-dependent methyltransferase [Acidobacteriota bacterium]|nr:class I SAM-dependent methyltransferase [Acidobacteriota bacterium]
MRITKERIGREGFFPPWVRYEHLCRYQFAATDVEGKMVVDCASADGVGSEMLLRAGARAVWALDRSRDTVLRGGCARSTPKLQFAVADATEIPLSDESVDAFVSLETIEQMTVWSAIGSTSAT